MGFQGYPTIEIEYFGESVKCANSVSVKFVVEKGIAPQIEEFISNSDAREDEVIQSALVKMIERSGAKSVYVCKSISISS